MTRLVVRGDQSAGAGTSFQRMNWEEKIALRQTAASLGVSPSHLTSIILFEMSAKMTPDQGVVFDPNIRNPGPNSTATGALQFIKDNWKWTGYTPGMSFLDQVKPYGPVHTYMIGAGIKPGMGFEQMYRTVHAGGPTKNAKDGTTGRMTSDIWPEVWRDWREVGVQTLYEYTPETNKPYLPQLPPIQGPPSVGHDVQPELLAVVSRARELLPEGFDIGMYQTGGTRTAEEQAALVRAGWSKTQNSEHLKGTSIDVLPLTPEGLADPDNLAAYDVINEAMTKASKELGIDVEWGGTWQGFKDRPHYQLVDPSQKLKPTYEAATGRLVPQKFTPPRTVPFTREAMKELASARYPRGPGEAPVIQVAGVEPPTPRISPRHTSGWTQVADLTQPEKRIVVPATAPVTPRPTTPVPIEYRTVTRERDSKIDINNAIEKMIRPIPGDPPTWQEREAVRLHGFDMRMITSGMETPETGLSLEKFEQPFSEAEIDNLTRTDTEVKGESGGDFSGSIDSLLRRIDVPTPRRPPNQPVSGGGGNDFSGTSEQMKGREPARLRVTAEAGQLKGAEGTVTIRPNQPEPRPRPQSEIDKLKTGLASVGSTAGQFKTQVRTRPEVPKPTGLPAKRREVMTPEVYDGFKSPRQRNVATPEVYSGFDAPPRERNVATPDVYDEFDAPPRERSVATPEVYDGFKAPLKVRMATPAVYAGDSVVEAGRIRVEPSKDVYAEAYGNRPEPVKLPTAPLPGAETSVGPAISMPQPGAVTGVDTATKNSPRPGAYPQEDTVRPSVERAPVVSPNSQMVMGIGVPERKAETPVQPAEPKPAAVPSAPETLPSEIPPETVPGSVPAPATTAPAPVPAPVKPTAPPTTIQPKPTLPVQQPSQTTQPSQPATIFPSAAARLAPTHNTVTSPVVQGNSQIANSKSGGPGHTYQTSVSPSGDGMVSWVRSDGSVITTYQDPSKGGGAIHGSTKVGMPVKTSSTSYAVDPSGASIW